MIKPEVRAKVRDYYRQVCNKAETAEVFSIHRDTVREIVRDIDAGYAELGEDEIAELRSRVPANYTINKINEPVTARLVAEGLPLPISLPKHRRTYLLTSAQNNTEIHEAFWANWQALAAHDGARVMVGGFIYRKDAQGQRGQEKEAADEAERGFRWDPRLEAYRADRREQLAPGLSWMGHINALPTNADPLAGLSGYSRGDSAVYPHVKVAMRSLATAPDEPAKTIYTTGAVTRPNYIQRKAGQVAEFHHVIGGLIVEVDGDRWWARQIVANDDGSFQDLDRVVSNGRVTTGHNIFGVNWGDIHERKLEPKMRTAMCTILMETRPVYQFFNDLIDAESANPHERGDHLRKYQLAKAGLDDVKAELDDSARFLKETTWPGTISVVVPSNHDDMIVRWLKATDPRQDPCNSRFWSEANIASLDQIDAGQPVDLIEWYMRKSGVPDSVIFIPPSKPTFKRLNIEFGQHGHRGPNGVKGTPKAFTTLATKININHFHGAGIYDGVYVAGVQARLFHGYNYGYSNWNQSMVFTYPNGKRAVVTMNGCDYRRPDAHQAS